MNKAITPPKNMSRLRVFDAMRGFSMLSVVFIHCLNSMGLGYDKSFLGELIITYFLSLFFFISGFFAFKEESRWNLKYCIRFITTKIKALIICPILFYALLHLMKNEEPLGWLYTGFKEYWFVIALFGMALLYMCFNLVSRLIKRNLSLFMILFVSAIGLGIIASHILTDECRLCRIMEIANLCYFIQFYSVGILCRKYQSIFERVISNKVIYSFGFTLYVVSLIVSNFGGEGLNERTATLLNGFILPYIGTYIVVSIFYNLKRVFDKSSIVSDWVCTTGTRTLEIYMIHYFFIPPLLTFHEFFAPKTMMTLQLIFIGALTIVITQLSLYCSYVIRISPFWADILFGVKRKRVESKN